MFKQRASFDQSYDEGRFGRFGRHILGAQMALDLPFGIGPLQFHRYFPEDTHNSYLNAFMSGGWMSGICYPALVFITVIMGFRHIFVRVPWQRAYLAIFSAFLGTVGESFIIDTDHWRHFWMMLGAMWGMSPPRSHTETDQRRRASRRWRRARGLAPGSTSRPEREAGVVDQPLDQLVAIAAPGVQMPAGTSGLSRSRQIAHSEIISRSNRSRGRDRPHRGPDLAAIGR